MHIHVCNVLYRCISIYIYIYRLSAWILNRGQRQHGHLTPAVDGYGRWLWRSMFFQLIPTHGPRLPPPKLLRCGKMARQLAFASPAAVFGPGVEDTFASNDYERFRRNIHGRLNPGVYRGVHVGHIFAYENGGPNCRDNIFMQEGHWNMTAKDGRCC